MIVTILCLVGGVLFGVTFDGPVGAVPGAVIGAGIAIWLARRRKDHSKESGG